MDTPQTLRPVGRGGCRGVHVHPPFRLKFINNSMQSGVFKTVTDRWPPTSLV